MRNALCCAGVQKELANVLLRRMKEDVESLPQKEEVVVWVELTHQQRSYYKALYANQASHKHIPIVVHMSALASSARCSHSSMTHNEWCVSTLQHTLNQKTCVLSLFDHVFFQYDFMQSLLLHVSILFHSAWCRSACMLFSCCCTKQWSQCC